ncbi:hypothetical protein Agabi119p4_11734 [Agaricus bisporus var. burnettii]|uniref:DNA polymerase lambda n=1 Tax=Agaricus bisporus var. burnettii TaxID=192524 RepID=A0A8H7C1T8_AGABI|nr:hypothetical protein Agabi119p4_11734 [Agaricus bisporus var. burnettii]
MDFDLETFYRERDEIMNQPDEDLDDYWRSMPTGIKSHFTQETSASNLAPFPFLEDSNESAAPDDLDRLRTDGPSGSRPGLQRVSSTARPSIGHIERKTSLSCHGTRTFSVSPISEHDIMRNDQHVQRETPVSDSSGTTAIESVEKMYGPETGSRAKSIVIKRNASPIDSASPAKRQKGGKPRSTREDILITHNAKSLHKSKIASSIPQSKCLRNMPGTGEEEFEQPSEILSFLSSPENIPQKQPLPEPSSPIASFSPSLATFPRLASDQQGQNPQRIPISSKRKSTVHGQRRHRNSACDPPTSPIEDPSLQNLPCSDLDVHTKGITASGSTQLSLEVKERVAKHAVMKRRDKVLPLETEHTEITFLGRSQSNKDPDQARKSPSASSRAVLPPVSGVLKSKRSRLSSVPPKAQKKQSGKKEKPRLMTPAEYAQQLLETHAERYKSSVIKFLEGKNIFYVGGDMQYAGERTRGRMELILKHGGLLIPNFDPKIVTHIVTDAPKISTLRALGYSRLSDIPDHIPTVKWNWILSAIGRTGLLGKEDIVAKMEEVWYYAAFGERMEASASRGRTLKLQARHDTTQGLVTPGALTDLARSSPLLNRDLGPLKNQREISEERTGKNLGIDPLAEFYAEARAAHENNWSHFGDFDESDSGDIEPTADEPSPRVSQNKQKRGWTCDTPQAPKSPCVNQDILEKLQELQELHKAKVGDEEHWRAYSYNKSIRAIHIYPKRIQSYSEARSIRGVGDKTALKIKEILQTGDLRRINFEKTDDVKVTRLFQGIYGVGQSTAFKWYSAGCRTLEDLRSQKGGVRLSSVQMIGLQYYDDINDRMPRSEAKAIFELVKPIALSFDSKLFVEIMGSFRRGKADCGDIDILITRPTDDGQTHSGVLKRLLAALHKGGIITEDLAIPENSADLECVYRGLCRLPSPGSRRRRIDFLTVPWESRGAALLYYTGDDIFNRAMRLKANKLGYSLNQRGLFNGVVRDVKDRRVKLNQGTLVASETEEEIFPILSLSTRTAVVSIW